MTLNTDPMKRPIPSAVNDTIIAIKLNKQNLFISTGNPVEKYIIDRNIKLKNIYRMKNN